MHSISLLVVVAVTVLEVVLGTPLQSYANNSTETRTVCLLPLDEGPCRGLLPRYYYNRFTQTCEEFAYGGCDGNANNFMFLEDCEKVCSKIKKVPKPCRLDADPGPCRAMFKKYAFNLHTMKCEKFMYGGCYGNDNNFKDEASCLESCAPKRNAPSFCYSPKDEGSCSASVTRYYFNIESKACEEFNYTGCGGNSNNFVKIEDCNSVCKKELFMSPGLQIKHMKNDSLLIPLNVQETTTHFAIGPQTTPQGTPNSTEVKDTPA